MLKAITKDLY